LARDRRTANGSPGEGRRQGASIDADDAELELRCGGDKLQAKRGAFRQRETGLDRQIAQGRRKLRGAAEDLAQQVGIDQGS
jgi:hypothetical protein